MGLFDAKFCVECGAKTNVLTRHNLADDKYLCTKCGKIIPDCMHSTFIKKYTYEDYRGFKDYVEYSNKCLRPQFMETAKHYTIHIDQSHRIFYLGNRIDENTVFFHFHSVSQFDLLFVAGELKEGLLGDKVEGEILFQIEVEDPYFYYQEKLDKYAKARAKKKMFGTKYTYENPDGMDEFIAIFRHTWDLSREEYEAEYQSYYGADSIETEMTNATELQQAMALFMLDSLENVTLADVRAHRNRMIKAFHPDKGSAEDTKYAQRINNAYEILKAHLE